MKARAVTVTGVDGPRHDLHMPGKPDNFTSAQIGALRRALRDYHGRQAVECARAGKKWGQGRLGLAIGTSQQVAGRLISARADVGMSYRTATFVAKLAGFETLDEFFRAQGVVDGQEPPRDAMWTDRELAVTFARRIGVAETAIANVVARYPSSEYRGRPTKWWLDKLLAEDKDVALLVPQASPLQPEKPREAETSERRTKKKGA